MILFSRWAIEAAAYQRGLEDAANHVAVYAAKQFYRSGDTPAINPRLREIAMAADALSDEIRELGQ